MRTFRTLLNILVPMAWGYMGYLAFGLHGWKYLIVVNGLTGLLFGLCLLFINAKDFIK